jgi:hypothetical protein
MNRGSSELTGPGSPSTDTSRKGSSPLYSVFGGFRRGSEGSAFTKANIFSADVRLYMCGIQETLM